MLEAPRHPFAFRFRRALNWFPLGLAYAFLYMGRYNLNVAKNALGDVMTKADFGTIFGVGAVVYGLSFLINGPLTDRIGGRRTMLIGVFGVIVINTLMGLVLYANAQGMTALPVLATFTVLYALNMYFQSFGAVAIVTIKAPWFHVRERGTFGTIFGIMIAGGIYFAYDWGNAIVEATRGTLATELPVVATAARWLFGFGGTGVDQNWWLFYVPSIFLVALWIILFGFLRDLPSQAGFQDFDTGEASVSDNGERLPIKVIFVKIMTHPVLFVICLIELCSGVLRNGSMQWYPLFAKETGITKTSYIYQNWGLMLLLAGIAGSILTGWASDRFFQSRRAPMVGICYGIVIVCSLVMCFTLKDEVMIGMGAVLISMGVIGVHGILAGTSTADFGGSKNSGSAVGIVDGVFYLGTAIQSFAAGYLSPTGEAAKDPQNWLSWPAFMLPFSILGLLFAFKIWSSLPARKKKSAAAPAGAEQTAGTPGKPVAA